MLQSGLRDFSHAYIVVKEAITVTGTNTKSRKSRSLIVCSCHVTYAFESESTLYSCLNVKELLARSRREI